MTSISTVRRRIYAAMLATSCFPVFSPTLAATQGTIGATSTGSVAVSASVPARARISNLSDVTIAATAGAVSSAQGPCVWSNTATRAYRITASGSGNAGAFSLTNGTTPIPYNVDWAAAPGAVSFTPLSATTQSAPFIATSATSNCAGGPDSTLRITIGAQNVAKMVSGQVYQGTMTLVVTPQ